MQRVAHRSVRLKQDLAAALDRGRIKGWPELDLACHGPGHFQRLMMRLGRQRNDQIEIIIIQLIEAFRPMAANIEPLLGHDSGNERVGLADPDSDGIDEDTVAMELLHDSFGDG